jgi:hypothetical protein
MATANEQRRRRARGKPRGPKPRETSAQRLKRIQRLQDILSMRLAGSSLFAIGQAQTPKISATRVYEIIVQALTEFPSEQVDEVRQLELLRLDELTDALYAKALDGDIAVVDRVLHIMQRRSRLMGVDIQPLTTVQVGASGQPDSLSIVRVEIINNPEIERTKWLEHQAGLAARRTTENLQ